MNRASLHRQLKADSDWYARLFAHPEGEQVRTRQKQWLVHFYEKLIAIESRLCAIENAFGHKYSSVQPPIAFPYALKDDGGDGGGGNDHYDPDEPRVPAGNPDGGQWTREGSDGNATVLPSSGLVMDDAGNISELPGYTDATAPDTWANPNTLEKHFDDHGEDFGFKTPQEYADGANKFYNIAQDEKFPAFETYDGNIKIYDPQSNTFGSYNSEGQTKTFFKPTSSTYFERQIPEALAGGGRIIEPLPIEDLIVPEIFIP